MNEPPAAPETQRHRGNADAREDEKSREPILVGEGVLDVMGMLLADKRSEHTRRAYRYDLRDFFAEIFGAEPTVELVGRFLGNSTAQMAALILRYKARLIS